jgi:hypothetical protein
MLFAMFTISRSWGLLPPPKDGSSDITELYVARYGVPKANQAIWIRTCQHIDGWIDAPKVLRARLSAPAASARQPETRSSKPLTNRSFQWPNA